MERLKELPWKSVTAQYFFKGRIKEISVLLPIWKHSTPQENWDTVSETQRISLKNRKSIRTFHLDRFEISISTPILAKQTFPEEKFFTTGPIPISVNVWFSLKCWSWWKVASILTGADVFVRLLQNKQTLSPPVTMTSQAGYYTHQTTGLPLLKRCNLQLMQLCRGAHGMLEMTASVQPD